MIDHSIKTSYVEASVRRTLQELRLKAIEVLLSASPVTATFLQILQALSPQDIMTLETGHRLEEARLLAIAGITHIHPKTIEVELYKYIGDELRDYSAFYQQLLEDHRYSQIPDSELDAWLSDNPGAGPVTFLLYGELMQWTPETNMLNEILVEDNDDDDDRNGSVVDGYLVSKGLAFSSLVDLLEISSKNNWKNWRALWDWF
jgi:hypothetical protein